MWQDWTNGILGLVIVGVAFAGLTGVTLLWTLAAVGAVVAAVGFWGAMENTAGTTVKHA